MARLSHVFGKWFSSITVVIFAVSVSAGNAQDRASWVKEVRWGVMNHYLTEWVARNGRRRNLWPDNTVAFYRDGKNTKNLSGPLLKSPTEAGETITVVVEGDRPSQKEIL